ncbi:MAG: hypothetical protein QNK37_29750 [Acidobacteriota bacterium]|nr:hypothetical protein [Acidobacteriota bacterium]
MSAVKISLLILLSPVFIIQGQDTDHQNDPQPPEISLLLSPGDSESLIAVMETYRREAGLTSFPRVIALEPGPLEMANGLRLLANEISPRLTVPRLLLISTTGKLTLPNTFLAFLRRCLGEGADIWWVGDRTPPEILDFPLDPGRRMEIVHPDQLVNRLRFRRSGGSTEFMLPHH